MSLWQSFLDAVLGPKFSCGHRVFPKDADTHRYDCSEGEPS